MMMLKLMWTKSSNSFSKFIRFVTGEDCSHFSFAFVNDGIVFESNLLGTHPVFLQTTLKTHTIIHEIDLLVTEDQYNTVWDRVVNVFDGRAYDYWGALYLGFWKLKYKFLKGRMPAINKWASDDKFFCNEIFDVLNELPQLNKIKVSGSMMTPHDVYVFASRGIENANI